MLARKREELSKHESEKGRTTDREGEREREREGECVREREDMMRHTRAYTHIFRRAKPPHSSAALHRGKSVSPTQTRHIKEPSQHVSIATPFSGVDAARQSGDGAGRQTVRAA